MPEPSSDHRILAELSAIYCREKWGTWPVAIEPVGIDGKRNYDVLAIRTKDKQAIVGLEVKVNKYDLTSGIKKGQFNITNEVTEMWLVIPQEIRIPKELPVHVGILRLLSKPRCLIHDLKNTNCTDRCSHKKSIYFYEEKQPEQFLSKKEIHENWNYYLNKWLWKIATSNATKYLNIIEANLIEQ